VEPRFLQPARRHPAPGRRRSSQTPPRRDSIQEYSGILRDLEMDIRNFCRDRAGRAFERIKLRRLPGQKMVLQRTLLE
jgi:hypothetical protein